MRTRIGLAGFFVLAFAIPAHADEPLPAPIRGDLRLTSTFGEYRSGHYHGGMDFSTGGRTGLPVYTPASGWVFRIRMSGTGYGRALYLRLEDGRTLVLAHLSRFREDIAQAAFAEQERLERYDIDIYPARGRLAFQSGEVIAWSGASGAGPPHLHAEIREGEEAAVAVNPRLHGWSPPDALAPSILGLRLAPWDAESHVEGALEAKSISWPAGVMDTVSIGPVVRAWVHVEDYAYTGGARIAPRRLDAFLDGDSLSSVVLDRFDWRHPSEVEWTFHEGLARMEGERWICLDPPDRSRQAVHQGAKLSGIELEDGNHILRVVAEDHAGNVAERSMVLKVSGAAGLAGASWESSGPLAPPASEAGSAVFHFESGAAGSETLEVPGFRIQLSGDDLFEDGWVGIRTLPEPEAEGELVPAGPVFRLEPWSLPLRNRVEVVLQSSTATTGHLGIYSWDGEAWTWEGNEPEASGMRTGIRNLEALALLRDETPPRLKLTRPTGSIPPQTRPRLEVAVVEEGSGISASDLHMTLNGRAVPAEWDPDARRFGGRPFQPLTPGEHTWRVLARDRAGNAVELEQVILVR